VRRQRGGYIPSPPPQRWEARITELGHGRYRVRFCKGALVHGPGDAPGAGFVKWGRHRAETFAMRMVTRLTIRDEREASARTWMLP
jgi:hypothetical protein